MVNKDDTLHHANQRRITPLVRNIFNSANILPSSMIDEGPPRLVVLPGVSYTTIENKDPRSCSSSIRGTSGKIVWEQNMSTLAILDFVLDILDDHECKYEDQEHNDH